MFHRLRCLCLAVVCTVLCSAGRSEAATITFEAIDLADVFAGEDLWSYRYALSGDPLEPDQGFAIFFDRGLYSALQSPTGPASWDILLLQPDLNLPSDGIFDAFNLGDGRATSLFTVDFVWLGTGPGPGAQAFEVYALDGQGFYTPLEQSATIADAPTAAVPEPATLLLVTAGLGASIARRRFALARKPAPMSV